MMRDWAERVGWLTVIFTALAAFVLLVIGASTVIVYLISLAL